MQSTIIKNLQYACNMQPAIIKICCTTKSNMPIANYYKISPDSLNILQKSFFHLHIKENLYLLLKRDFQIFLVYQKQKKFIIHYLFFKN
jgi:hypothetical protein